MIKVLALDIDGVLTDGKVTLAESGKELKTVSYLDIDSIFRARKSGLRVVLLTGESTPWVDMIARRLEITEVYQGAKDKGETLRKVCLDLAVNISEVCYVGDSDRDVSALGLSGLSLAPKNASSAAKAVAHRVLLSEGGNGAIAEAVEIVSKLREGDYAIDGDR